MVGFRGSEVRSEISHPRQQSPANAEQDMLGGRAKVAPQAECRLYPCQCRYIFELPSLH
jgi:hypothetical protein